MKSGFYLVCLDFHIDKDKINKPKLANSIQQEQQLDFREFRSFS